MFRWCECEGGSDGPGELSYALWGHGGRAQRPPDGPDGLGARATQSPERGKGRYTTGAAPYGSRGLLAVIAYRRYRLGADYRGRHDDGRARRARRGRHPGTPTRRSAVSSRLRLRPARASPPRRLASRLSVFCAGTRLTAPPLDEPWTRRPISSHEHSVSSRTYGTASQLAGGEMLTVG